MLETVAMVLFILWVLGLIAGYSLGGAIHVLLLGGIASLYIHHRAISRRRLTAQLSPSRMLANIMGKPPVTRKHAPPAKKRPGGASNPSAAA